MMGKEKGRVKRQRKVQQVPKGDVDALFLGDGIRAITRKTLLPGYTVSDLEQFVQLVYGMFDEQEAKRITVYDPFAKEKARRITVARLADALETLIASHSQQKSA
jgi:hypothetical protein